MRSSTVIVIAALLSAPALSAAQGSETTQSFPSHFRHEKGLNHESYRHNRVARPFRQQARGHIGRRYRQASDERVGEHYYPHHDQPRYPAGHRQYGRYTDSRALSVGTAVNAAKDAYTIGTDAYDVYEAGKDAWKAIKSRADASGAISVGGALQAGNDAVQIGNDVYDAYEAGKDAWSQVKGRSLLDELD
ncbi:uncharacterized protein C8Q71DRAFT_724425 [Rhodofomes roseus]|uniref:Uncharacterized protein n=1 Tax=Rhodofomes roseus TaxID=34475 RepID=A0ABQ8KEL3_9APHY|nr:uncharacterized protein C8Q71DRAFT_724425 [Rhodofomes roseus]KAH9835851.1 hypothetical protein C8Q71DRAFT_724425 [Rhodofomes roseus]